MRTTQLQRDRSVILVGWIGGLFVFAFVIFAPTTIRATVVGTAAVAVGIFATRYYLMRPQKSHPIVFNNGELRIEASIINSPFDEFETQRRVAGIAHTLVACVSRPKHMPREATRALKSINDVSAVESTPSTNSQPPVVINVTGAMESPVPSDPDFSFVEDDENVMEAEVLDENSDEVQGKCVTCSNDAEVLLELGSDDDEPLTHAYCHKCAEVVNEVIKSDVAKTATG